LFGERALRLKVCHCSGVNAYVSKVATIGPVVSGTMVPVRRLYGWYLQGVSVEQMLRRYPSLRHVQVFSALAYAFEHRTEMDFAIESERAAIERQS
jgi:uncharacterized protein (DUF433 family)